MERRLYAVTLALLSSLLLGACGSSADYMTAYVDPDFTHRGYDTIAVQLVTDLLDERKSLESSLVEELDGVGIRAYESGRLFTPTREWDSTEVERRYASAGITGRLRIEEIERWTEATWIPEKTSTTVKTEEKKEAEEEKGEPGKNRESEERSTTTTINTSKSGGYTQTTEHRRFRVDLIDVATGRIAWTGVVRVKEEDFDEVAERVTKQLRRDGMIARSK